MTTKQNVNCRQWQDEINNGMTVINTQYHSDNHNKTTECKHGINRKPIK